MKFSSANMLKADNELTFSAEETSYTLTVTKSGGGDGTITSIPSGINYGTDGTEDYLSDTVVSLTATPDGTSTFTAWSGDVPAGPELVTNGGFASVTTGWTAVRSTIASVAGGQDGNCLEITRTGDPNQYAYQQISGLTIGLTYSISGYVKSGTSGNEAFVIGILDSGWAEITSLSGTSSGSWVQSSGTFATTDSTIILWLIKSSVTAGTMLFDTVSLFETHEIDNPVEITMSAAKAVDAEFAAPTMRTLTVTKSGAGTGTIVSNPAGINYGADDTKDYTDGTVVYLTANADGGSAFTVWSGEVPGGHETDNPVAITMSEARDVDAEFAVEATYYGEINIQVSGVDVTSGGTKYFGTVYIV